MPGLESVNPPSVSEVAGTPESPKGASPYVGRSRVVGGGSDYPGGRQPAVVLSGSTSTVPYGGRPERANYYLPSYSYYLSSYSSAPRRKSGITVTTIATTMAASITAPAYRGLTKIVLAVPNATMLTHR
jgi:hypothetical protein